MVPVASSLQHSIFDIQYSIFSCLQRDAAMTEHADAQSTTFALAAMSPLVAAITWVFVAAGVVLPVVIVAAAPKGIIGWATSLLGTLPLAVMAFIWLVLRPGRLEVTPEGVWIHWPVRRRLLAAGEIADARVLSRKEVGFGMRVFGAGGVFGGFGWFWSRRVGLFHAYATRNDGLVLIRLASARPLIVTPARPEEFVQAVRRGFVVTP
jgi:hypothetical protein